MLDIEQTDEPPPGYFLSGDSNNAGMYLWSGEAQEACSRCGTFVIDKDDVNPKFNLDVEDGELIEFGPDAVEGPVSDMNAKRVFDFSYTYDDWMIVSTAFRDTVLTNVSTPVEFIDLPREPGFFVMRPSTVLEIDKDRSNISVGPECELCDRPQGAWGTVQHVRHPKSIDPLGIYCGDVKRGDVNRMSLDTIVGPELAHRLRPLNGVVLYHAVRW